MIASGLNLCMTSSITAAESVTLARTCSNLQFDMDATLSRASGDELKNYQQPGAHSRETDKLTMV